MQEYADRNTVLVSVCVWFISASLELLTHQGCTAIAETCLPAETLLGGKSPSDIYIRNRSSPAGRNLQPATSDHAATIHNGERKASCSVAYVKWYLIHDSGWSASHLLFELNKKGLTWGITHCAANALQYHHLATIISRTTLVEEMGARSTSTSHMNTPTVLLAASHTLWQWRRVIAITCASCQT